MLYIFDWDGTLLDSTAKIVSCMHKAIAEVGMPARTDDEARNIIGLGLPEAIRQLFPAISDDALRALRDSYSSYFIAADKTPCDFFPHVEEVLHQLREQGHQLAVATGKSRRGLNRVLDNLNMQSYFDATRCADETASKPDPLMLEALLAELNHEPKDAIMVGDTEFDLLMAQNAGIRGVGVSYGAHSVERLLACQPLACIDDFQDLLNLD